MKKILVPVLLSAIISIQAHSQVEVFVKAGANFTDWVGDQATDAEMLVGIHGGVGVQYKFGEMFAAGPEFYYSGEGVKFGDGKITQTYLRIPVLFRYIHTTGIYAETGPGIGFLLNAEAKQDGAPDQDMKEIFDKTDFSWSVGLGYRHKSGIGLNARYNIGLTEIPEEEGAEVKNTSFNVGLIYFFSLNKN